MLDGEEGLRERNRRQTRELIATAAMRLFAECGFDNVTVPEIAEAAGVAAKTVYNFDFFGAEARRRGLRERLA